MEEQKSPKKDSIGVRLRRLREARGYSQEDLGNILGVSDKTVGRYESGENSPQHDYIERMAEKLNCNPVWLFTGIGTADDLSPEIPKYSPLPGREISLNDQTKTDYGSEIVELTLDMPDDLHADLSSMAAKSGVPLRYFVLVYSYLFARGFLGGNK